MLRSESCVCKVQGLFNTGDELIDSRVGDVTRSRGDAGATRGTAVLLTFTGSVALIVLLLLQRTTGTAGIRVVHLWVYTW